jgi:nicotinamidase/pyrazinamidase
MRALLLVDIQNDFMPFGSLPVAEGDAVVSVANALSPRFELVVATQDWHPAAHLSFASNHPGHTPAEVVDVDGLSQILWPDHCVQNSPGASFHSGLDVERIDHVVRKGTDVRIDSYSAFFDNRHARDTGLTEYLKGRDVRELAIVGLATDYCVRFSALDAIGQGFSVTIVRDGVRGVNVAPHDVDEALAEMIAAGCRMTTSEEALRG